jgi:hypothetical protein
MPQDPDQFDDLAQPLVEDLRGLYRADIRPSPAVDQAILNRARAHVAGRKRTLLLRRVAGAAAAVILVAAALIPFRHTDHDWATRQRASRDASQTRADIDINGAVDIRDALALARRIDEKLTQPNNDLNGDNVIDRRDVDAIAMMAVRLDREPTR